MSVALVVFTDGRDTLLEQTITSAEERLEGPIVERWIHDDTGDDVHRAWIEAQWPSYRQIGGGPRRGFGGAIRHTWARLVVGSKAEHVFHLEDDFIFRRSVDLAAMAAVLDDHHHLVQLALRRQPWNDAERAAGGIVEQHPDDYLEISDAANTWLEHRRFFTTNPSLYRRSLCRLGWPNVAQSEGVFTHQLTIDPAVRFGYWGDRGSGEAVEHLGHVRAGAGY